MIDIIVLLNKCSTNEMWIFNIMIKNLASIKKEGQLPTSSVFFVFN